MKKTHLIAAKEILDVAGFVLGSDLQNFFVYIHKSYFPRELWPSGHAGKEDFEQWKVKAVSRNEAAKIIWQKHGKRLLKLMEPKKTKLPRKVFLYVSSPKSGVGGKAGRMPPILVYTGD